MFLFFFSSRRRHTRLTCDWSSDVCSSDLGGEELRDVATNAEEMNAVFELQPSDVLFKRGTLWAVADDEQVGTRDLTANVGEGVEQQRVILFRSEERRVGKECRSRGWPCR